MVKATASGVERDRLGRPPDRLEVPGKVVRRRSRPRLVHYPDRLDIFTYSDTKEALYWPRDDRFSCCAPFDGWVYCRLVTGSLFRRTTEAGKVGPATQQQREAHPFDLTTVAGQSDERQVVLGPCVGFAGLLELSPRLQVLRPPLQQLHIVTL